MGILSGQFQHTRIAFNGLVSAFGLSSPGRQRPGVYRGGTECRGTPLGCAREVFVEFVVTKDDRRSYNVLPLMENPNTAKYKADAELPSGPILYQIDVATPVILNALSSTLCK